MIAQVLRRITLGENIEIIREIIASYIGIGYWEKLLGRPKTSRDEIYKQYENRLPYSEKTTLLEDFFNVDDFMVQAILKNTDNDTLVAALYGASGNITNKFLANISDRLLWFIYEDISCWSGTEEQILKAQRRLLSIR